MINGIHHVGLTVGDISAAQGFYIQASHLEVVPESGHMNLPNLHGGGKSSLLRGVNAYLRLLAPAKPLRQPNISRPVSEAGITHFCMQAPDITSLHADFSEAGASFHSAPVDLGTGFLYCYSRDLEDNVVELEGVPRLWSDPRPWFAHFSITTADIKRLSNFYAEALGRPAIRSPHIGPNSRFDQVARLVNAELKMAWIPSENIQIEVIQYLHPATVAGNNASELPLAGYSYICFEVSDARSELARLIALGATQSPELASLGDANRCLCADPDGNIIMLMSLLPEEKKYSIAALKDPMIVSRMTAMRENNLKKNEKI